MKRKLLIVTANDFLVYQPTILNLYDFLKVHFDVSIISFEPEFIGKTKDETRNIIYLKIPLRKTIQDFDYAIFLLLKVFRKILPSINYDYWISKRLHGLILQRKVRKSKSDIIVAVDTLALFISQNTFPYCHFVSLEIYPDDPYLKKIDAGKIQSVVIQNQQPPSTWLDGNGLARQEA